MSKYDKEIEDKLLWMRTQFAPYENEEVELENFVHSKS